MLQAALDFAALTAQKPRRRRVYIGREEHIERVDAHATGDGPPL